MRFLESIFVLGFCAAMFWAAVWALDMASVAGACLFGMLALSALSIWLGFD